MATIDPTKDIKPIIKTDWTKKNTNSPFYQQAEGDLPARYSVSIQTNAETTNSSDLELENIKNSAIPSGFDTILSFYEKQDTDPSKQQSSFAEEWYISERPGSKIKVLVSISSNIIDSLQDTPEPEFLPTPWKEVYLNTFDFQAKVDGTIELLRKYELDIKRFQGKVQGINLSNEIEALDNSVQVVAGLLQSNEINYDIKKSDLINLGIDDNYQFLYGQINDGNGFQNLYKGFNTFKNSSVGKNKRTVNFLLNLDQTYEIYLKNDPLKFQEFFETYVLNPPRYEFSVLPRKHAQTPAGTTTQKGISEDNSKPLKSSKELQDFVALSDTQEQRDGALKVLESTANFVGDTAVGGIQEFNDWITLGTSYLTRNPGSYLSDGMYQRLLNKIPLQDLIRGALECLGFPGFEFINLAQSYLSTANSFLNNVASLINRTIPKLSIPDDFPIADYMADLGKKIFWSVLEAVQAALIQMLVELLQSFLDACKECALTNVESGQGRFDGLNFFSGDFLATSFATSFATGIEQGIRTATGTTFLADQALSEARQSALNPVLLNNKANQSEFSKVFGGTTPEEFNERLELAKVEFRDYISTAGQILTPAEAGNLLLGCQVGNEPVDALTNLANSFPNIKWALAGGDDIVPSQITGIWEDLGKIVGDIPILEAVKNATESIPIEFQCLCDADDTKLRERLLKDKGLSDKQIKEQVEKSIERRNQRLEDLANALEKGNILDGMIPPIYCTVVFKDPEGDEVSIQEVVEIPGEIDTEYRSKKTGQPLTRTVQKGMIEKDHPTVTFLIDQVLETVYDAVEMAFNEDISGFVSTLSKDTIKQTQVSRVVTVKGQDGSSQLQINPEWLKLVKDPQLNYSWGPLPNDAAQPGTTIIDPTQEEIQVDNAVINDEVLGSDLATAYSAGQMQSGQSQPTAEQVAIWEAENLSQNTGGRQRPTDYDTSDLGRQQRRYSEIYGYSPIPVTKREQGPKEFAPGLGEAYTRMCSEQELFNIQDDVTTFSFGQDGPKYHVYSFMVENNLFEFSGISEDVKKILSPSNSNTAKPIPPNGATETDVSAGLSLVTEAFRILSGSEYDIRYVIPFSSSIGGNDFPKETYGLSISLTPPAGGSVQIPPFPIYQDVQSIELSNDKKPTTSPSEYNALEPYVPQEQFFSSLLEDSLKFGAQVYPAGDLSSTTSLSKRVENQKGIPNINIGGVGNFTLPNNATYKQHVFSNDFYDEAWKDFFCAFTKAIGQSPFLDLSKLGSLNFVPSVKQGEDPSCDPSLLDITNLKQRIKDEYSLIQCIESAFPNVDGLGSNKDNPFEKSNLSGAVLATVRTYVIEILMRTMFTFYYFKFTTPDTVDNLLINYISSLVKKDVEQKGFINEFRTEALDLYNRTVPDLPNPLPKTTDFNIALDYFVRNQIYSVANKITKTFNILGDTSVVSYLLDDQSGEVAWIPAANVPATPNDPNRILNDEIKPPAQFVGPVPPDLVRQLVGNGTLSPTTKQKFDSTNPQVDITIVKNLPIGSLFREYYGKENYQIWSREGPQGQGTSASPPTDWAPITGQDPVSVTKIGYGTGEGREGRLLKECGILDRTKVTSKFLDAYNINPDLNSRTVPGTVYASKASDNVNITDKAYEFGVSYVEKLAMKKLLPIIASGVRLDITDQDTQQFAIDTEKYELEESSTGVKYYPGKILKERTEDFTNKTFFTFAYDQVWDKRAWNNTGVEVPQWIRDSFGITEPTRGLNSNPPYTRQASVLNDLFQPANRGYSADHWYQLDTNTTARVGHEGLLGGPPVLLRWVEIDGKTIGPWKPFNVYPGNGRGAQKWKLIDPGYRYTDTGGKNTDPSLTNIGGYNNRTDVFATAAPRQDFLNGVTVGTDVGNPSLYGVNQSQGNVYISEILRRAANLIYNGMGYMSLLDVDVYSIKTILMWEKSEASRMGIAGLPDKYDEWIGDIQEIIDLLELSYASREIITQDFVEEIYQRGIGRNPLPEGSNPGQSFKNGNFIKEIYLRVTEHPYQGVPPTSETFFKNASIAREYQRLLDEFNRNWQDPNATPPPNMETTVAGINQLLSSYTGDLEYQRDIRLALWKNSNFVDKGGRNEYLKGVVNIQAFQDYINSRFDSQGNPILTNPVTNFTLPSDCHPQPLTKALIRNLAIFEECGEAQAKELGLAVTPSRTNFLLGDFFKDVRIGVRISYVEPIDDFAEQNFVQLNNSSLPLSNSVEEYLGSSCWRFKGNDPAVRYYREMTQTTTSNSLYDDIADTAPGSTLSSMYQKAYYVPNGDNIARVIPIVCSEMEIDSLTDMSDIVSGNYTKFFEGQQVPIGFFEHKFNQSYNDLKEQLKSTQEFKTLFNYMFPLERMLSLNNVYGSEYLRSYKGIPELFDPTKTRLKDLFFTFYNSGNYKSADCIPSNKDLQINMMNGIPWEGIAATLAIMIAKTVVLIFKGFVEAFDVNIIVSKTIKDSIRLVNQLVAQGLTLANQTQQLGSALGNINLGFGDSDGCSPAAPGNPKPPPDAWFDPVDENFIPEPQIMFISLALLPITLLPLLWPGLPITPFGLAYWFLDAKPYDPVPGPNWLNAMPPSDFLDQLFNRADEASQIETAVNEGLNSNCSIDIGLLPPGSGGNNGE